MTKTEMIKACKAHRFTNTDGEWCTCTSPELFKKFIESKGFNVISCESTANSNAKAFTDDGFVFLCNGYCTTIK